MKEDSNGLCAVCLDDNVYKTKDPLVHHIIKIRSKPDMAYDEDNLICLCRFHHHMAESGLLKVSYLRKLVKKRKTPPVLGKKNKKTTCDHTPPLTLQKI